MQSGGCAEGKCMNMKYRCWSKCQGDMEYLDVVLQYWYLGRALVISRAGCGSIAKQVLSEYFGRYSIVDLRV